jgi:hypothetical protein
MFVLDVGFGFAVTDEDLFAEGIVIFLEVFDGVFHLVEIGRKFKVDGRCVRSVDGGGLFRKGPFLRLVQAFSVCLMII